MHNISNEEREKINQEIISKKKNIKDMKKEFQELRGQYRREEKGNPTSGRDKLIKVFAALDVVTSFRQSLKTEENKLLSLNEKLKNLQKEASTSLSETQTYNHHRSKP